MDEPEQEIKQLETNGAKSERFFKFAAAHKARPKMKKSGGEDAWLGSPNFLAVADGIGDWEKHGIHSGVFSKALVTDLKKRHAKNNHMELKQILVDSIKEEKPPGTSTVVMAKFDTSRENYIKTTNIGDSGYILYRPKADGKVDTLFRSKPMNHKFNYPF